MFIHFEEEDPISYPYEPITLNYKKQAYLIVPDFFKKISKVTIEGSIFEPLIVPQWLPFTIFSLGKDMVGTYNKFLTLITKNTKLKIGSYKKKIKNCMITYHKIIPDCSNSPRFYLYSFDVNCKLLRNDFTNIIIKDKFNKLFGIYYYHEKINEFYRFHFMPISLIIGIISGNNDKIISLPFERQKIIKLGKNNVVNGDVFNYNLKMNLPVDINLLIEGNIDDKENVVYKDKSVKYQYYLLEEYENYIFKKGKQDKFSSMDGNTDIYQDYIKIT